MKRIILMILTTAIFFMLTACGAARKVPISADGNNTLLPAEPQETSPVPAESNTPASTISEDATPVAEASETAISLTVGEQTFSATLLDNETARQFAVQFPLTLEMSELNGNEKYYYMDNELPTDSYQPGQINAGDLMLYGNNCFHSSISVAAQYRLENSRRSAVLAF